MKTKQEGFILPIVLLISIAIIAVGLSLLQSASSISQSLQSVYVNRLASESADSGIVYANYCLGKYGSQTWNAAGGKPLTQSTDCYGTTQSTYQTSFFSSNGFQTTFSVGDNTATQVMSSVGTANVNLTTGGTTYSLKNQSVTEKQTIPSATLLASQSAAGTAKTCGVVSGSAYCWGSNSGSYAGQLGNGTNTDSHTPVAVLKETGKLLGKSVTYITAGEFHVCALASGVVYCWGQNSYGQLGNGSTTYSNKPVQVGGALAGLTVTNIGIADDTTFAIAGGKIYAWGDNQEGTAGTNSSGTTRYLNPTLLTTGLPGGYVATAMATGDSESRTACAIVNSQAYCWGDNRGGGIGNNTSSTTPTYLPTAVTTSGALAGKTIKAISVDGYNSDISPTNTAHACVIASDNQLYCWGDNDYGELGIASGDYTQRNVPTLVSAFAGKTVKSVGNGVIHMCVLADSWVYCAGSNVYGQQGSNQATNVKDTVPTAIVDGNNVLTGKTITSVSGGAGRACLIADYSTFCWGFNSVGQIGDGTTTNRFIPTLAAFLQPKTTGYLF